MKRNIWLILIIFIFPLIIVFQGCTLNKKETTKSQKSVVIWHMMVDRQKAFEELADKYAEERGVKVEFKLFFPPDIYSQKVIAAARAGNLPDIFGILGEKKTVASFIKAGHIANLTSYLKENNDEWRNRFYPLALNVTAFQPNNVYGVEEGFYGIPLDMMNVQWVYNRDLLKRAGINPDEPIIYFDQFVNIAKSVKEKLGVSGFVCGWGEPWLMYSLCTEWAINLMGEEKFFLTLKGKIPYTDPDWIKVFSLFERLRNEGVLADNIVTIINKEAEDSFSKGEAVFSFNGSWAVNVYRQLAPELNYGFFPLPRISDEFPVKIWGGAGFSFMVYPRSPKKELAIEFLKWITDVPQQEFLVKATNNLPSIRGCEGVISGHLGDLFDDIDCLTHPNIWPYEEDSRVIEIIGKVLQQIVIGIKTPQSAAEEIQNTKNRVMGEK
ncbi:MAG: extracellular solute-binding protein [Candidatus Omnitrophica bacterium]|nr:extracellular solute-binding protein [Candidatus Omnitrophota bacterium]